MKTFLIFLSLVGLFAMLFASLFHAPPHLMTFAVIAVTALIFSKRFRRVLLQLGCACCALLVFAGLFMGAPPANAADPIGLYAASYPTVTNQPATVAASTTTSINSFVKLYNGDGLAIAWKFNQSGATTSNATLTVYSSVDGTNISTAAFATLTAASSGTNTIITSTNWSPAQLAGLDSLVIGSMQNTSGTTTLTNKALIVRRPN